MSAKISGVVVSKCQGPGLLANEAVIRVRTSVAAYDFTGLAKEFERGDEVEIRFKRKRRASKPTRGEG